MIELRDIHFSHPGGGGLAGIDLAVARGERLALLGSNGAGKTTLLQLMAACLVPAGGSLSLGGVPLRRDRAGLRDWRRRVALVFQDPDDQLFAARVFEDVSFGPMNLGLPVAEVAARVEAALAVMDIADLADRATHMLSFGQRKRVTIAGALALHPEILLLDEPTAGLDTDGIARLRRSLDTIGEAGTTIVLATHDMDFAYGWADRIAMMGGGRLAGCAPTEQAFDDGALLAALALRRPVVRDIHRALAARGLVPALPAPRDADQLIALIAGAPLHNGEGGEASAMR